MDIQAETEEQFIKMVHDHERIINKVCSLYVSDRLPVEDLRQETVYNLWKAYPKFRGDSTVSTWVYRIALNTCISGLRKNKGKPQSTHFNGSESLPADTEDTEENIRELYRLIYRLKSLERAIIMLWLEEKSYQEIADITGLSVSNVAVRLNRIREKLKTMYNS